MVVLGACAPTPPTPQSPYARDLEPLLLACTSCHNANNLSGGLDMTNIQALIGEPSRQSDLPLIEPGNHLRSYLWHKVSGTQSIAGGLGQRMPALDQWSEDDIARLQNWIDLGAPP